MSLTVHSSGGDFEQVPEGVYQARCFQLIDIGTQTSQFGEAKKILVGWELFGEVRKDGSNFTIQQRYTASLNNKATLYKDLQAWRGKPFTDEELAAFDLKKIVNAPCQLQIQHKANADGTRTYSNITAIMAVPKGMTVPPLTQAQQVLDLDEFDAAAFNTLGNRLKLTIQATPEWGANEAEWTKAGAEIATNEDGDPVSQVITRAAEALIGDAKELDKAINDAFDGKTPNQEVLPEPKFDPITPAQKKAIITILGSKGIALPDEREKIVVAVAHKQGHEIEKTDDLSKVWASDVISDLETQNAEGLKLFFGTTKTEVAEDVPF